MLKTKRRRLPAFLVCMVLLAATLAQGLSVSAAESGRSYSYDSYGNSSPAPSGYSAAGEITAAQLGSSAIGIDLTVDDETGEIYVLNSDDNIIQVLDAGLGFLRRFEIKKDGEPVAFTQAQGIYLSDFGGRKTLYICDTENGRILVADTDGTLLDEYGRPDTTLIDEQTPFRPTKAVVNDDGTLFVICQHIYSGAVMMDNDGNFLGFFGANKVYVTAKVLLDYAWKKLLNEEAQSKTARYVPTEYASFDIDEEGFIYTCTSSQASDTELLRRINPKSTNIFDGKTEFGDFERAVVSGSEVATSFIDIVNMGNGVVAALDTVCGRVFIYDKQGSFLTCFGSMGNQTGTFQTPVAIEAYNDDIYVLDKGKQTVTQFSTTSYGTVLLEASRLFLQGRYDDSIELWETVLRQNQSFETAYVSIGRSLQGLGKYDEAAEYFKKGQSPEDYSMAFEQMRKLFLHRWFKLILAVAIVVFAGLFVLLKIRAGKKSAINKNLEYNDPGGGLIKRVFTAILHPNIGLMRLIKETRGVNLVAPAIMLLWFVERILAYQFTGFTFNENEPDKMNIWLLFTATAVLFAVFVVSNWLICTVLDGSGKLMEIANVTAVALIPYLMTGFINIILSNMLTIEEGSFLTIISVIGIVWSLLILISGIGKIHETGFIATIGLLVLTVVGVFLIYCLALILYSLFNQVITFFSTVLDEFMYLIR